MANSTVTGQSLQTRPFKSSVVLIPQILIGGIFTGLPYKAELVLMRGELGGARQHVWFAPDPRPHNHPWEYIDCKIIKGQYTSKEYVTNNDTFDHKIVQLHEGDPEHRVLHSTYHQVYSVTPGTISIMSFGKTIGDGQQWGHLTDNNGVHSTYPNTPDPVFLNALRHLNPSIRPIGWEDPFDNMPVPSIDELMNDCGL